MVVAEQERTDEQLMIQVAQNDTAAFRHLYEKYSGHVLGFAGRIIQDRTAAEDIVQETFWRMWHYSHAFDPAQGSFTNWLLGIARNLCLDLLRRRSRLNQQELTENTHTKESLVLPAVDDIAANRLQQERVQAALVRLPREQRDVIEWIFFQGKTRRAIADEQDIPFGTINSRARLALQKLRRVLQTGEDH
ncbi:MAG: sigma-70 family RNA polymerase sigma factor [Chloroflexota bacterium]